MSEPVERGKYRCRIRAEKGKPSVANNLQVYEYNGFYFGLCFVPQEEDNPIMIFELSTGILLNKALKFTLDASLENIKSLVADERFMPRYNEMKKQYGRLNTRLIKRLKAGAK